MNFQNNKTTINIKSRSWFYCNVVYVFVVPTHSSLSLNAQYGRSNEVNYCVQTYGNVLAFLFNYFQITCVISYPGMISFDQFFRN